MIAIDEKMETYSRVYARINLDAIVKNLENMKSLLEAETQIMAVIKTDGYGHGAVPIAKATEHLPFLKGYAVATAEEAHILRCAGIEKPILILGYTFPYSYRQLAIEEIRPAVFRRDSLPMLNAAAQAAGKKIKVHIKVDTGMGRIGIRPDEEGIDFVREILKYPDLEIEGIFTHFARADEFDKSAARNQFDRFLRFCSRAEEACNITIPLKHCANSASILELPGMQLDMTRAGITLYGLAPSEEVNMNVIPLEAALSLHSHIVYLKDLNPGESVSYGGTFTATRKMQVATIPVGYGDGYPRLLSGCGSVLIRGQRAPILGRVCMDQFMVDVTEIAGVCEGDPVTLIGRDKAECITAEELGDLSGRFNYELVCDLGRRIPRVYMKDGKVCGLRDAYSEDYLEI